MILGGKGGRCVGLTTLPLSCADCLEIWEPQPPGTLRACSGLYWDCFTITFTYFCQRLSRPQSHSAAGRIMSMKNCNETTRNRKRDLLTCSAVPQPTAPQSQCQSQADTHTHTFIIKSKNIPVYLNLNHLYVKRSPGVQSHSNAACLQNVQLILSNLHEDERKLPKHPRNPDLL